MVGYLAPNMYLFQKGFDRTEKIKKALPDAIDLLTISVEAGLGFDSALQHVAKSTEGPLADEFARVLQEMQIGLGRSQALRALGERTTLPDLRGFVSSMVQADAFGIPIGQVLRVQSSEIRIKRRQRAEELAQKVPVKILPPLIFCILPCLFIAVMGPAALTLLAGAFRVLTLTQLDRIALASRIFCLLAAIALTSLTGDLATLQFTLLVATVGVDGLVAQFCLGPPARLGCRSGGLLCRAAGGYSVATTNQSFCHTSSLPHSSRAWREGLLRCLSQCWAKAWAWCFSRPVTSPARRSHDRAEFVAPWLVVSFGAGLLGAWLRVIGLGPATPHRDGSYEAARRLVTQLRTVARTALEWA